MRGLLEVLVLDAIAREPRHGYALIRDLERVFGEEPNRNQIYPLLNRLEADGLLRADREGGRGKTRYALTGAGLERLKEYRLRTPEFRQRVLALWAPENGEARAPAAPAAPEPAASGAPHLLDRLAVEGDAPPLPPAIPSTPIGPGHAGQPCAAEIALRRQAGSDRVSIEFRGLDPDCPVCRDLAQPLRAVRDRWF